MLETHVLDRKTVTENVARKSIGCYQFGNPDQDGKFVVGYIGRSTKCLRTRLIEHPKLGDFTLFRFVTLTSPREVFDTECRWFHLFRDKSQDNLRHPDSPRLLNYKCKYCKRHPSMIRDEEIRIRGEA